MIHSKHKKIASRVHNSQEPDTGSGSADVVVGKDILELLGSSMYVNPLTIYREYIQNAVDAIDDAVDAGLLETIDEGRIDIVVDHIDRRVVVRDNGIGIGGKELEARMTAFGASSKRGTTARGFRGVGRLAGLGYCQELIFRSRGAEDRTVREIRWDCRKLKTLLFNSEYIGQLGELVKEITAVSEVEPEEYPLRFFEVEIIKPRRIGSDVLLNERIIEDYVAQHSPVPFSPAFKFGDEIREIVRNAGVKLGEYHVYINDNDAPVYRPYGNEVIYSETKSGLCQSIESIEIMNNDDGLAAVGWLLHHDYQGAIPVRCGTRGLRARAGNIQIGDERIFSEIYPEERFNSWTIGEVHVADQKIIPNGRRDNFEPTIHFSNLTNQLKPYATAIAKECRSSSQIRNRRKAFDMAEQKIENRIEIIHQGAVSKSAMKNLRREMGTLLAEMRHVAGIDVLGKSTQKKMNLQIASLENRVEKTGNAKSTHDPLEHVQKSKRQTYKEVFSLIYECAPNSLAAKSLVDKILARLSKT